MCCSVTKPHGSEWLHKLDCSRQSSESSQEDSWAPNFSLCWRFAKLVKASDFDSDMHRFESYTSCHIKTHCSESLSGRHIGSHDPGRFKSYSSVFLYGIDCFTGTAMNVDRLCGVLVARRSDYLTEKFAD